MARAESSSLGTVEARVMVRMGRAVVRLRSRFRHFSRAAVAAWLDDWAWTEGRWYAASEAVHLAGLMLLMFIPWKAVIVPQSAAPTFVSPPSEVIEPLDVTHFHLGEAPLEPSVLNAETLRMLQPSLPLEEYNDDSKIFKEAGGGTPGSRSLQPGLAGLGGFHVLAFGGGPGSTAGAASAAAPARASIPAAAAPASVSATAAAGIARD